MNAPRGLMNPEPTTQPSPASPGRAQAPPYQVLGDEARASPCLVLYLSEDEAELLSYDYFVGGTRKGQELALRFSSTTVGLRFGEGHDVGRILEWVGGKKVYSFAQRSGECVIEVVKPEGEE